MKKDNSRAKITIGSDRSKIEEILVPHELMEQTVDDSSGLWYESEDEKKLREKKEDYNKQIFEEIEKLVYSSSYNKNYCGEAQIEVFEYMFKKGLTLTQTARALNKPISYVQKARNGLLKKIKKKIKYMFENKEINETLFIDQWFSKIKV